MARQHIGRANRVVTVVLPGKRHRIGKIVSITGGLATIKTADGVSRTGIAWSPNAPFHRWGG